MSSKPDGRRRDPLARVDVDPVTGCWNWKLYVAANGYPRMSGGQWAHRAYYELFRGPIPHRFTVDHLCRNIRCVNPDHLEAVTDQVNILRGDGPAARNARRTHCAKGHEFTPENTIWRERADRHPWRTCRICLAGWRATTEARRRTS